MDLRQRRSFLGLILAQAFGAFNDNCFKSLLLFYVLGLGQVTANKIELTVFATVLFILPFILFSTYAGRIADRCSKSRVTVWVKFVEIFVLLGVVFGFWTDNFYVLVSCLFLLAAQSAFFSPSKYGILPEMIPAAGLPRANGILELTTFLASIGGTVCGGVFYEVFSDRLVIPAVLLFALSFVGYGFALLIARTAPAAPDRRIQLNPLPELLSCFRSVFSGGGLGLVGLGVAYFWSLAGLIPLVLMFYGDEVLGLQEKDTALLMGGLGIGIGSGSLFAGLVSRNKPELGLVPIGSFGMGILLLVMASVDESFGAALFSLCLLGLLGGFFIVPLNVFVQQEAGPEEKGRIIAGVNFLSFVGMLLTLGLLWLLMVPWGLGPLAVFVVLGVLTTVATVFVFFSVPRAFFRFLFWLFVHVIYRVRIVGVENVPLRGPALFVANHASFVDGLLIMASTHRFIRFVVYKGLTEIRGLRWLAKTLQVLPVSPDEGPREIVKSLRAASDALSNGELVCIFAEGQISRTGQLLPFRGGVEKILKSHPAPVIPVYLDRVWGSIFSFKDGKFFWKIPRRIPYPVTLNFGEAMPAETPAHAIRQAVQELGSDAFLLRKLGQLPVPWALLKYFRRRALSLAIVDSMGTRLSRARFLSASFAFARTLRREFVEEPMIGILLPPSSGACLANMAGSLLGKPVVNFNYTAGKQSLESTAKQCGITKVLTSRAFLEKFSVDLPGDPVYLEDIREGVGVFEKLLCSVAWMLPVPLCRAFVGGRRNSVDDVLTVIFSSGSTGDPKGIELTHFNVLSNIQAVSQVFNFRPTDRVLGVLPFFHSTGYTITMWLPLLTGTAVVYHPNPLDARTVGHLVRTHNCTVLIATPTFLQNYTRRCEPGDFGSLRFVVVGAEKLSDAVRSGFLEKFGIEPLEGYGATECSPLVSVNVPDFRGQGIRQVGAKRGIGHPLPGVSVRIVDPESGQARPIGDEGLLLVKGPNVMKGYLGRDDLTQEAVVEGWYRTGDIARLDDQGFLNLTDRLSRFAKIAGEMVPHLRVEEALLNLLDVGEKLLVVTSIPDKRKGERLAVVHVLSEAQIKSLIANLEKADLPNLWLPREDSFVKVENIPVLGTGKVDLRAVRLLARQSLEP